jgi:hypothetical protein
LADKTTQLILSALGRAAAEPGGVPLVGTRSSPGLFAATPLAKQAAQRCVESGYLRPAAGGTAHTITDRGLAYLLDQVHPRQVLEDLVRALESRESQLRQLLDAVRLTQTNLEGLRATAETVLAQVREHAAPGRNGCASPKPPETDWTTTVLALLTERHASGVAEDCPLPELFRHLQPSASGLTVGRFHDGLRRLHDEERIYLHPWTGPLYALPEPPYALLVGHEVAYYVSLRSSN